MRQLIDRLAYRYIFWPYRVSHLVSFLAKRSFSQTGEDSILQQLIGMKLRGTYIDIGCGHPVRGSNTYHFYVQKWSGLAIDASPKFKNVWKLKRPRDTFLCGSISLEGKLGSRQFFQFYADVYSTLDETRANQLINAGLELQKCSKVHEIELRKAIINYMSERKNQSIDLLSVDVEGLELEVLKVFPWLQYKPSFVCVEELQNPIGNFSLISNYLAGQNYTLVAHTGMSSIYMLDRNVS